MTHIPLGHHVVVSRKAKPRLAAPRRAVRFQSKSLSLTEFYRSDQTIVTLEEIFSGCNDRVSEKFKVPVNSLMRITIVLAKLERYSRHEHT